MTVLRGDGARLLGPTGATLWTQNSAGVADASEAGDGFGAALAAADFGNGARDDLAVGVPGEGVGSVAGAGAVAVLYSAPSGLAATGSQFLHQNSASVPDSNEPDDGFGASLSAAEHGAGDDADLVVGAPHENLGSVVDAGALTVFYGDGPAGLGTDGLQGWNQNSAGIRDAAETGDRFGDGL